MKFFISTSLIILFLSACAAQQRTAKAYWPSELPAEDYFLEYYANAPEHQQAMETDEYLLWVKRFYLGWELYRPGWLEASKNLVATVSSEEEKRVAQQKTQLIGQLVAPEWAKENKYRLINSRHLVVWGNALNESISSNQQIAMLDKILNDIEVLLDRRLAPNEIAANRYYQVDSFGDDFE